MTEPPEPVTPSQQDADEAPDHQLGDKGPDTGISTWATLREAASVVGVSSKAIRRAIKAGTIDGHRSGGSTDGPWLVRLEDVEARWGGQGVTPDQAADATAAQPTVTSSEPLNEADTVEVDAGQADVRAEIAGQPLGGRLSALRRRLVVKEPQRRWWRRPSQ